MADKDSLTYTYFVFLISYNKTSDSLQHNKFDGSQAGRQLVCNVHYFSEVLLRLAFRQSEPHIYVHVHIILVFRTAAVSEFIHVERLKYLHICTCTYSLIWFFICLHVGSFVRYEEAKKVFN